MKKQYTEADMEIVWLKKEDIITESGSTGSTENTDQGESEL